MANGAAAKAVAPEITKPCKNSGALNLICMKGILRVKGPHLIPLLCDSINSIHFDNSDIPSSSPFNVNGNILLSTSSLIIHKDEV